MVAEHRFPEDDRMIERIPRSTETALGFRIAGHVGPDDYEVLVPAVAAAVKEHDAIGLLLDLAEFQSERPSAWAADIRFGHDFHKHITRLAIVGDKAWEEWLAKLAAPFYAHEARFFHSDAVDDGWTWIEGGGRGRS
jgi:SpoIIAA-like